MHAASTTQARSSGFTRDANGRHGFLLSGGTFFTTRRSLRPPGHRSANGINDMGQIVGQLRRRRRQPRLPHGDRTEPAAARRHHRRHDPAPRRRRPLRDLRHRRQRVPGGEFLGPGRNRFPGRRAGQLLRQRHHRHAVAQRHDRRVRGLRHQQQQHHQCRRAGHGRARLPARGLRRLQS